jgi:hypothetical protein
MGKAVEYLVCGLVPHVRTLSTKRGSVDSLKVSSSHGLSPKAVHIRLTVGWDIPSDFASPLRRVSSFLRQLLHRNTVSVGSSFGSLIHATVGSAGGSGRLRTKRSGWAA